MIDKLIVIPWWRVMLSTLLMFFLTVASMFFMSFYRLASLPYLVEQYCSSQVFKLGCISNISQQLLYASQWLAIQFLVYLVLNFVLWPIFHKAAGSPIINGLLVGILNTILLILSVKAAGIEFYASFFSPLFIGLLIQAKRNKQITFNPAPSNA